MMAVSLLILGDVSWAVYNRILAKHNQQLNGDVSYVAHLAGAVMGLLVGFLALRNRHVEHWEIVMKVMMRGLTRRDKILFIFLQRILLPLVIILFAAAIGWNIFC